MPRAHVLLLLLAACAGATPVDADGDGAFTPEDCDDADAAIHPGVADGCDGVDNDCDGQIDEEPDLSWFVDADGDGFGEPSENPERLCGSPTGHANNGQDCDDTHADVFPGADELCDGADNDCDGSVDEGVEGGAWFRDADGDGLGDADTATEQCAPGDGWVANAGDCDDTDATNPAWVSVRTGRRGGAGTADDPFASIMEALDATPGGCVFVDAGAYDETVDFHGRDHVVVGVGGPSATLLRGTDGPTVRFDSAETNASVLAGFTIAAGTGVCTSWIDSSGTAPVDVEACAGGGIHVGEGSPLLIDLVIQDNVLPDLSSSGATLRYGVGGGLYIGNGEVYGANLTFTRNSAYTGGAVYVDGKGSLTLVNSVLAANEAQFGAAVTSMGQTVVLQASIVADNDSRGVEQAVLVGAGELWLANVTAVGNDTVVSCTSDARVTVLDSILAYNSYGARDSARTCAWTLGYTNFWGNERGNYPGIDADQASIQVADPRFLTFSADGAPTNDDLHLDPASPCVDAGYPDAAWNDADGTVGDLGGYGGPNGSW